MKIINTDTMEPLDAVSLDDCDDDELLESIEYILEYGGVDGYHVCKSIDTLYITENQYDDLCALVGLHNHRYHIRETIDALPEFYANIIYWVIGTGYDDGGWDIPLEHDIVYEAADDILKWINEHKLEKMLADYADDAREAHEEAFYVYIKDLVYSDIYAVM